jgi:YVTN family beta-propeller protein
MNSMRTRLTWAGRFVGLFAAILVLGGPAGAGRRKAAPSAPAAAQHNAAAPGPAVAPAVTKPWVLSVPCTPPATVFTPSTVRSVPGASSAGAAGDVNNDGFADVVVGAESPAPGSASLYLGSATGLEATPAWTGNPGPGYTQNAFYGAGVSGVGDVNGDGYDDVVVGAPDYLLIPGNEFSRGGKAFLYLGGEGGLAQTPAWTAEADSELRDTDFAQFVEGVGDVTGDGVPDVLISDYNYNGGVNVRQGKAYLYGGGAGGGLSGSPAWSLPGDEDFQHFGWSLAGLGDVDGDGIGDFAVSGDGRAGGINNAGRVTIYKGGSFAPIWTIQGTATTRIGRKIAAAGDVNGDGLRDLLVSSISTGNFNGRVSIYCGSTSGISHIPCWYIEGPNNLGNYGSFVSGPGDVSGDGYDDILFNGTIANEVVVVRGSPVFPLQAPVEILNGTLSTTSAGRLIAGAGDVNGDGGLDAVTVPIGEVVKLWQGTTKHTEIIDPACSTELGCMGDYLIGEPPNVVLDTDVNRLVEAPVHRIGTVTDGVSRLLVRRISSAPVTFTLKDFDGNTLGAEWGTLSTREGEDPGSEITITPENGGACQYALAVYTPPVNFPGTEQQVGHLQFKIDVNDGGGTPEQRTITLRPPPFVLVHGVWSGPGAWQEPNGGLLKYLSDLGFPNCGARCLANYGYDPAASFDPREDRVAYQNAMSSLSMATNSTLISMRQQGIADSQVDVVGHSEGGLVARALVATKLTPYRWKENYGEGYFHKLITIGSPHHGTALADFFLGHACDHLALGVGPSLETFFEFIHRPIGPAIYGFQTNSEMLEALGQTDVQTHPIAGIKPVPAQDFHTEWKLNRLINWIGSNETIDTILNVSGQDDAIVPRLSQLGGIPVSSVAMDGIVHASIGGIDVGMSETSSAAVWQNVKNLLLRSIDEGTDDGFASVPVHHRPNPTVPPLPIPICPEELNTAPSPSTAEVVLDPPPGTVVHPGDVVDLVLTVTGGDPVDGAIFSFGNGFEVVPGPGPHTLPITITSDRAGRIDIRADTYGPNHENYSADTWIQVETATDPTWIEAFPSPVNFTLTGRTIPLTVRGLFPSGAPVDMTSSTAGTAYAIESGTSNVITVSAEGLITAVGSGSDRVIVTHGTLTTKVPVTVLITNLPPAIQVQQQINLITGSVLDVPVTSTDPEAQHVTLTADDLPAFASFTEAGDGTATLQLAPVPANVGTYTVYVAGVDAGIPPLGAGAKVTIVVAPPPPTIASVSPNLGLNNDPTVITITGASFQATPQVYLGTAAQPQKYPLSGVTFDSSTQLHVTVPVNLVSALYRVTVVNPDSISGYLDNAFTIAAPLQGGPILYIGEPNASQLTQIDLTPWTLLSPLAFTAQDALFDVAVNRTGTRGVTALLGDNQPGRLGIISLNPAGVVSKMDVPGAAQGRTPRAVAIHPSGNPAYVLTANPTFYPSVQELSRFDFSTGTFTNTISLGSMQDIEAADLQVSPDGQRLYATNVGDDTISVIRTSDFTKITDVAVGNAPVGIGVSPDSTRVYVTNNFGSTISKIDATLSTPVTIGTIDVRQNLSWTGPNHVVVSPDGANLYVAFTSLYNVSKVNVSTGAIGPTLSQGGQYSKVAYVPSLAKVYAIDFDPTASHVRRLNPETLQVEETRNLGPYPYGMDWAAAAPTITSIVPIYLCKAGGDHVTITGSAFQGEIWDGVLQVQQKTRVFFGGVEATWVNFVDSTHLSVTTPAHANGWVNVEVRNPNGLNAILTNGVRFTFCQQ